MNLRYKIANKVSTFLAVRTNSTQDKKEEMIYGVWNSLTIIMFLIVLYIIKLLVNIIIGVNIPVFVTYISFFILRTVLGGFHLNNPTVCFVSTIILIIGASFIAYFLNITLTWLIIIYIIGVFTIHFVGVVDTENKRYSQERKVRYKKIGFVLLIILFSINITMYYFGNNITSNAITVGVLLQVLNLLYVKMVYYK